MVPSRGSESHLLPAEAPLISSCPGAPCPPWETRKDTSAENPSAPQRCWPTGTTCVKCLSPLYFQPPPAVIHLGIPQPSAPSASLSESLSFPQPPRHPGCATANQPALSCLQIIACVVPATWNALCVLTLENCYSPGTALARAPPLESLPWLPYPKIESLFPTLGATLDLNVLPLKNRAEPFYQTGGRTISAQQTFVETVP